MLFNRGSPICPWMLLLFLSHGGAAVAQSSGKREMADSLGRKIALPARVDRILSLQPEVTRIIVALGAGPKLVGVDYFIRQYDHLLPIAFPEIAKLPAASNTPEDMNFEAVMRLAPDVIFASPTELRMVDALAGKIGKPLVALASMGSIEKLLQEIDLVGRIVGREQRAAELIGFFNSKVDPIRRFVAATPRDRRPRVYLSFWATLTRTPVKYEPVSVAGGINCAEGLLPSYVGSIATVVQVEQILQWAPEIILLQGNYLPSERSVTVQNVLEDRRLGSLPAVRGKRIHYTFGFWYWWDPAEVLVETMYLANLFHPSQFGTFDLEKDGNDVYQKFYGVRDGFSSLCRVLNCREWK
jgi:iron complex transport system substrate-binding protein